MSGLSYVIVCFQLTPFPFDLVKAEILKYPRARLCWAQEEHKNMGAWFYVEPRINTVLKKINSSVDLEYVSCAVYYRVKLNIAECGIDKKQLVNRFKSEFQCGCHFQNIMKLGICVVGSGAEHFCSVFHDI